jgi:hypothetical protein
VHAGRLSLGAEPDDFSGPPGHSTHPERATAAARHAMAAGLQQLGTE